MSKVQQAEGENFLWDTVYIKSKLRSRTTSLPHTLNSTSLKDSIYGNSVLVTCYR